MEDKAKFLLEMLFDDRQDKFIRRTAREALNGMGVTDAKIGAYRHRREFKTELDGIHTEMEREVDKLYGYSGEGQRRDNSRRLIKAGLAFSVFLFIILIITMAFVVIGPTTTTKTASSFEQTTESSEGNDL